MSEATPKRGAAAVRSAGQGAKVIDLRPGGGGSGGPPATDGPLIVDLKNAQATAKQVIAQRFEVRGVRVLHFHSGRWLHWNGATCKLIEEIKLEKAIVDVLEHAKCRDRDGHPVPVKLSERLLTGTLRFMRIEAENDLDLPGWLPASDPAEDEGMPAAADVFVCANRLIDLRQGLPFPPHPRFLSLNASAVLWDDHAECPQFLEFLDQIFERDAEQISELRKWAGYTLMGSTFLQTALLLIGPPRSGKGTLARLFRAIVGTRNCEAPSLASLQERFGLAPLIDKRLAIIDEATLGAKVDRGEVGSVLRKWIAGDPFTVDQKHGPAWTGPLSPKIMLITNEIPTFSDASAALATRFLVLRTVPSFVGREDRTLEARLMEELPGIFRWAVEGARLLIAAGGFSPPAATRETAARFKDQMADVAAFVKDECKLGGGWETKETLYGRFKDWSDEVGFEKPMAKHIFGKKLLAACPNIRETRLAKDLAGRRPWAYEGISLVPR